MLDLYGGFCRIENIWYFVGTKGVEQPFPHKQEDKSGQVPLRGSNPFALRLHKTFASTWCMKTVIPRYTRGSILVKRLLQHKGDVCIVEWLFSVPELCCNKRCFNLFSQHLSKASTKFLAFKGFGSFQATSHKKSGRRATSPCPWYFSQTYEDIFESRQIR